MPKSIYAEAVSNEFLDVDAALTPEREELLRRLGWHPPRTPPSRSARNWWRVFDVSSDAAFGDIANVVVETLSSVYDYAEGPLSIETSDAAGNAFVVETAD